MKSLICIIDKKLFQAVDFQDFKTVDIQKAQGKQILILMILRSSRSINLVDNPLE